ncbi:MAG: hypothetical protein QOJ52_3500 [Acidimicrobiaceae bacterium]|nr:hypothetical protein [Acidimicrobiaceae bacterium]
MTNLVPNQYRQVAVASVDFTLDAERLSAFLLGREVYKRTRYVVVRHGADTAIVEVDKAPGNHIMAAVTSLSVLALPHECAFVTAPDIDTGIPSSLAHAARECAVMARAVVVEGRYHHVNFILDPSPAMVRVVDVVPPGPPKLVDQASRVLAVAEDLPPIELVADVVDLSDLARSHPAETYLLPCRGSGFVADGAASVAFLDERPPRRHWTLIGCARSRELHRWFYGDLPETADMCPRVLAASRGGVGVGVGVTLTKCCLLEDRIDCDGDMVVVPWGASLEQVRQGLHAAAGLGATWSPA